MGRAQVHKELLALPLVSHALQHNADSVKTCEARPKKASQTI